jgi:tetratricopeptide (TPR) repeat protein
MRTTARIRLCLPLIVCLASPVWATEDITDLSQRIELPGYRADTDALQAMDTTLQAEIKSASQSDKYLYYYLGYTEYNLAYAYAHTDTGKATDHVEDAQTALLAALKLDPDFAEAEALLSTCYGLEIGLHPFKGMYLGAKTGKHMARAMQLAPGDPRVLLLKGISDFQTPGMFGGDKQRALQEFHAALVAFDSYQPKDPAAPSWGKALTYNWLGFTESRTGQTEAARADYAKALALIADYKSVQQRLADLPPAAATTVRPTGNSL